jgi:HAE1 family hydrophobic/amphiphilic exporter-1
MKTEGLKCLKAMTRMVSVPALVVVLAFSAAGQDPAQNQQAAQGQGGQNPPLSRPIGDRTVGLDPGKIVRWTMRDAIIAALDKNVDIELERENVRLAQWDVLSAQGFYDPTINANLSYNSFVQANTRLFSGTAADTLDSATLTYNFGFQQSIERTGGFYQINFNNQRNTNNFGVLTPQYSPQLNFSITQPIFRNFGVDQSRRLIKINKKRLDLSDAVFRQRAIEIISNVQRAYWDLALAIKSEKVGRDAVELADTQLRNNQRQVEVGTLAPIDVINAATLLETRRTQVFQAINAVAVAENALKALTVDGPNSDLWNSRIEPVEPFDIQPVVMPLPDALKLAVENRPEIKQLGLNKEMNEIDIDFFRNQAKPQIDFVASYTMNGVGGDPRVLTSPNCGSPVVIDKALYCLSVQPVQVGNTYVPGVVQTPFQIVSAPTPTAPQFIGGYGTALRNMFSNDFRTWAVGLNFSFPLRNRTAKANLNRAKEVSKQLELQNRRLLQNIEVEVRNAVQAVETAKMRIESSKAAREYAQQQLEGEEKKFQAGLSTTFFVLQRQTDLSQAQLTEIQALADYNKAVADLQRVISTTLSSNNIEVKSDTQPMK